MQTQNAVAVVPAQKRKFMHTVKQTAVAVAAVAVAGAANAAVDITPITTLITEAVTAATAIGIGFLGFTAGMSIYKKLRGAA